MATAYYFTHTQIRVDPTTPVSDWSLSDEGRARIIRVTKAPWMAKVGRIVASPERRTLETAEIFARRCGLPVEVNTGIADTNRPGSEFLSVADLDTTVDAFLARPDESARPGWETATDGRKRVAAAVDALLTAKTDADDILFVGHGRIGTLLMCHLAGLPLAREHFQPTPGGNLFAFDCATRRMIFRWRVVAPPL